MGDIIEKKNIIIEIYYINNFCMTRNYLVQNQIEEPQWTIKITVF